MISTRRDAAPTTRLPRLWLLAAAALLTLFASACDDGGGTQPADDSTIGDGVDDADVDPGDLPDIDPGDTSDVGDSADPDLTDTIDVSDLGDTGDATDTTGVTDTDTTDVPDTVMPPLCEDECSPDEQLCDGSTGYRVCGQFDEDACLELSQPIQCATGYSCAGDRCVPGCRDECPVGSSLCADEMTVQVCGSFDQDICREPGGGAACATGERCEAGACVDSAAPCSDECAMAGDTVCFGDAVRTCGDFDSDSCLDLGPPTGCGLGEMCDAGECVAFCQDACAPGTSQCLGDGVSACADLDGDGCTEWGAAAQCPSGQSCSAGSCQSDCTDECDSAGALLCSADGSGVQVCGDYDSDSCLDLRTTTPCPAGFGCQGGLCVSTCTDECTVGASRCNAAGTGLESCGNYDADTCAEWGGAVGCPGGASCSGGACDLPCSDECTTSGASECVAGQNSVRTCGQYDLDACLEYTAPTACASFETCNAGQCEVGTPPAVVLVNEVLYDSPGGDTAAGTLVFVELAGPAGQSLDGYAVVGINGNGGGETTRVALDGEVIGSDGLFVIAHPSADAALAAVAELTSSAIDLENGPDNVRVEWHGVVVDALGYGTFGAGDVFAGEGSPAPGVGPGSSLSRDASSTDTDDNSADFSELTQPSPGGGQIGCTDDCTVGSTQCVADQIQSCGNYDADSCLEWSTPAACSTPGNTCQGGVCLPPCADECPGGGATQCVGDQIRTCGNYDGDGCLEWSTSSACSTGQVCVVDNCQSASAPEVVLISPQGTLQTTQGATHRIRVDPTPAAGRTISSVNYYADGMLVGTTTAVPHQYDYTVPASHPTNTTITLQARATDSVGEIGASPYAWLDVRNDAPEARFTATITNATQILVDASSSTDTETATGDLEVCWDWNNDGTCETAFSTTKTASHDFGAAGTYTVRMVVRDAIGQTDETTRQVTLSTIQYVGGTSITTQTWVGTIFITGDVTVPAGETLTIAEGTQVLFVNADVAPPMGIGDYGLLIEGTLVVQGTAANPVIFSGQDATAKVPGGWDRIEITGNTPSSISHAIIEYADIGLDIHNGSTVTDVSVTDTANHCVRLVNGDNASLTRLTVTRCGVDGVHVTSGSTGVTADTLSSTLNGEDGLEVVNNSSVVATGATLSSNSGHGAHVGAGSTLDLSDSTVDSNDGNGLIFRGNNYGDVTRNQVRFNGGAGLTLLSDGSGTPSPVVHRNNLHSNATVGSPVGYDAGSGPSASYTCCSSSGSTSAVWTPPAGTTMRRVQVSLDVGSNSSYDGGRLLDQNGGTLSSWAGNFNGWVYIPAGVTGIRVQVYDSYSGDSETISVTAVEVVESTGADDIVAITDTGTIDLRKNYLGTFPNVLTRVSMTRNNALDLQGFVGAPFDPTWDTGTYYGGESLATTTWSGTVHITGNVAIPAAEAVTVSAGTQILFVDTDQNGDTRGDWSITANGRLDLMGAVGNEVVVTGYGTPDGDDFTSVRLSGSGADASDWQDVLVSHGWTPIVILGDSSLTRVQVDGGSANGISIEAGTGAQLDEVSVDGAGGHGVAVSSAQGVDIDYLDSRNNGGAGVRFDTNATGSLEDATIRDNASHGVQLNGASPAVNYNNINYNGGAGIYVSGNSSPTATYNVIKFNDDAGVLVVQDSTSAPTPTVNYSNVFGNAVAGATSGSTVDPSGTASASYTCCSSSGSTSAVWTPPAGTTMRRVQVSLDVGSNSSYDGGRLLDQNGGTLSSWAGNFNGWVYIPAGVTGIRVQVYDSYSGDSETISVTAAELVSVDPMASYELSAVTDSGQTDARFNYWTSTLGDVPSRIFESRPGGVDYTGFVGMEYPNGSVLQVGPRP